MNKIDDIEKSNVKNKITISFVTITFNEEKNIKRLLESIKDVADEIIILDSGSNDKTTNIALTYNAKVYYNAFIDFASQKNLAISYATCDYIFVIDADEALNLNLKDWLLDFKNKKLSEKFYNEYNGFYIARKSMFLGKWIRYSGWFPDYTLRFFKKGCGQFKPAHVHESLEVIGKTYKVNFKCHMLHYTYHSLTQYFEKFNNYTTLAAYDLFERKASISILKIIFNPIFSFIKQYFLKLGFLDGFHGFILAICSAFYVFIKYTKYYFLVLESNNKDK